MCNAQAWKGKFRLAQSFPLPTGRWRHKKRVTILGNSLRELWYHQESNRGHKDFQSFALPTELWHHCRNKNRNHFLIAGAKVRFFFRTSKILSRKISLLSKNALPLHHFNKRDLAQLVAHVVRDDGVAGSSPVIPTTQGSGYCMAIFWPLLLYYRYCN